MLPINSGIYIDCRNLYRDLYRAQFAMTKANRIIMGDRLLNICGRLFGNLIHAIECPDERLERINAFITDFSELRIALEICNDQNIIAETRQSVDRASGQKQNPDSIKISIFESVARIDDGITKWRNKTKKARSTIAR